MVIKEYGFCLLAYSEKTVKVSFWKQLLGIVLAIVSCLFSACSLVTLIVKIVISFVIKFALQAILSAINSPMLAMILQIAFAVGGMLIGGVDFSDLTAENYLALASSVAKAAMSAINMQNSQKLQEEMEHEAAVKAGENIEKRLDKIGEATGSISVWPNANMDAHFSFMETHSPDVFFERSYGAPLYNYDQYYDVDTVLEIRKKVESG
jgi:hypothetical protein